MNDVVIRRNIQRYRSLLDFETNERRRRMLLGLLAEEEANLARAPPKLLKSGAG